MIWPKKNSKLSGKTMKAMLIVRQNCDMYCDKFYVKIVCTILKFVSQNIKYAHLKNIFGIGVDKPVVGLNLQN